MLLSIDVNYTKQLRLINPCTDLCEKTNKTSFPADNYPNDSSVIKNVENNTTFSQKKSLRCILTFNKSTYNIRDKNIPPNYKEQDHNKRANRNYQIHRLRLYHAFDRFLKSMIFLNYDYYTKFTISSFYDKYFDFEDHKDILRYKKMINANVSDGDKINDRSLNYSLEILEAQKYISFYTAQVPSLGNSTAKLIRDNGLNLNSVSIQQNTMVFAPFDISDKRMAHKHGRQVVVDSDQNKKVKRIFRYKRIPIHDVNLEAWHIITLSDHELDKLITQNKRGKYFHKLIPMYYRYYSQVEINCKKLKMLRAIKYNHCFKLQLFID